MANYGDISYGLTIGGGKSVKRTTADTGYEAKFLDADFYKYSIVTSVASGNLTVALKNYNGDDPSATAPVKIQIGDTIREVTSALSVGAESGINWFNLGSTELATEEVDLFVYLSYVEANSAVQIGFSRIPNANIFSDFGVGIVEKGYNTNAGGSVATDKQTNIGRFNATLSAGAGYTWSIPATSIIINRPCFETRVLDTANFKIKVIGDRVILYRNASITIFSGGESASVIFVYPITYSDTNYSFSNGGVNSSAFASFNETAFIYHNSKTTTGLILGALTRSGTVAADRTTTSPIIIDGKW